jgi:N-formylglutamate deformylase
MNDEELIAAFEARTVPLSRFRHIEHVRLVWVYLQRRPLWDVIGRVTTGLRELATAAGHAAKYHETLTGAYCLVIHERFDPEETWDAFVARNPDLVSRTRALLTRYWSEDLLRSPQSRRRFMLPYLPGCSGT